MNEYRHDTVMMSRVRNEARWIGRSLERTFRVAETVAIWNDGSNDDTELECYKALGRDAHVTPTRWGWIGHNFLPAGPACLHFIHSPFTGETARPKCRVNEIRDKNGLWEYAKVNLPFSYVLCLDGDEMLSHEAIERFPETWALLDGGIDILSLCFVYLWDGEDRQRVDGIYGNRADGQKILQFPRLFTIKRVDGQHVYDMRFAWQGTRGGFHCGSVPREAFVRDDGRGVVGGTFTPPVVHFGYLAEDVRQAKYEFYNWIDPKNEVEGEYLHVIGKPNQHAPGPVVLEPWADKKVRAASVIQAGISEEEKRAARVQWKKEREAQEVQWAKEDAAFGEHWAAQHAEHRRQMWESMEKKRVELGMES